MIDVLEIMNEKAERIRSTIDIIARDVLIELEWYIISLNVEQLNERGINSEEKELPGPYAPFTIAIKEEKGQPTDHITLRDTGDFQDAFFVNYQDDHLEISSNDEKTDMLVEDWGENIFGLIEQNQEKVSNEMLEYLPDEILKIFYGND